MTVEDAIAEMEHILDNRHFDQTKRGEMIASLLWTIDQCAYGRGVENGCKKETSGVCESPLEFAAKVIVENAKEKGYQLIVLCKSEILFTMMSPHPLPLDYELACRIDRDSFGGLKRVGTALENCLTIRYEGDTE